MTKFFTRAIGPKEAEELLAHNYDKNRNVRKAWVKALANMMKQGQFIAQNGDVIRVGRDGTLYDGQHRLMAVIESGTTQYFDFAEIDTPETAFVTMDNGAKRGAADFVNGADKSARAAVASAMLCVDKGRGTLTQTIDMQMERQVHPNRIEIVEYANKNEESVEFFLHWAKKLRRSIGTGSVQTYAMLIYLLSFCDGFADDSSVPWFIEDCCRDAPESPVCMAFVKAVSKAYLKELQPKRQWLISKGLAAYVHYKNADGVTSLGNVQSAMNQYEKLLQARRAELRGEE